MGEVFLARENNAGNIRAVVVKKVLPTLLENPQFVGRFLDESKVVVRLAHPHIARVYSMGEVDGAYYLAMEYVQGKTVSRFMHRLRQRKQQLSLGHILLIGEKMCEGLQYAHDAKDGTGQPLMLVHRDLSPANVCVGYRGEVKIIDFGAAQSRLKEQQTAPRIVIGNLTYMAPEQARKQPVDRRADIYSTGAVLWELLAWSPLPQKGDPVERWRRAANPAWPPPSSQMKTIPRDVDMAILRALHKDAKVRFPDAKAFGAALKELRLRYGQGEDEKSLGELLTKWFGSEKDTEDSVLADILYGVPDAEMPTMVGFEPLLVPPTALAFEHSAVSGLEEIPADSAETADPQAAKATVEMPRRSPTLVHARVAFGGSALGGKVEDALAREIEPNLPQDDEPLPPSLPAIPSLASEAPALFSRQREKRRSQQDVWRIALICGGAFSLSLLVGFLVVFVFARVLS